MKKFSEFVAESRGDGKMTKQERVGADAYYKKEHGDLKKGDKVYHDSDPDTHYKVGKGFKLSGSKFSAHIIHTKTKEETHYPVSRLKKVD